MERITKKANKKNRDKNKKKPIKIVLGITCWSHLYEGTESSLYQLTNHPYIIGRVKSTGALVYEARNEIVKNAIEQFPDMTHLLFIDSDMTFGLDHMLALAESGKDIISGVACRRTPPFEPCYLSLDQASPFNDLLAQLKKPIDKQKPFRVDGVGMAFTLISKKVLVRNHYNKDELWFYPEKDEDGVPKGEDYAFCNMAKKEGFKIWIHPTCQLGHLTEYLVSIRDWLNLHSDNYNLDHTN